jgi:hypothetical protein
MGSSENQPTNGPMGDSRQAMVVTGAARITVSGAAMANGRRSGGGRSLLLMPVSEPPAHAGERASCSGWSVTHSALDCHDNPCGHDEPTYIQDRTSWPGRLPHSAIPDHSDEHQQKQLREDSPCCVPESERR